MKIHLNNRPVLGSLRDGLIICRSMPGDAEGLAEFNSRIHSEEGFDKPDLREGAWTHDLLSRPHPPFHADHCTLNKLRGFAAFPDLSFLQLVIGCRSIEELEQSFADCWYKDDETRVLLSTLFPNKVLRRCL